MGYAAFLLTEWRRSVLRPRCSLTSPGKPARPSGARPGSLGCGAL